MKNPLYTLSALVLFALLATRCGDDGPQPIPCGPTGNVYAMTMTLSLDSCGAGKLGQTFPTDYILLTKDGNIVHLELLGEEGATTYQWNQDLCHMHDTWTSTEELDEGTFTCQHAFTVFWEEDDTFTGTKTAYCMYEPYHSGNDIQCTMEFNVAGVRQ